MQKRKFDELVSYFNKKVSEMEIETKYKMELLGMVTALGCAHEKEMSDLSETKRDSSDTISRQAAIDAVCNACSIEGDFHKCDGYPEGSTWCEEITALRALPSVEPKLSRVERELHGKTPEEQYDFIYWLLLKFGLGYTDSRLAILKWLRGEEDD